MFERLTNLADRRGRRIFIATIVVLAAAFPLGGPVAAHLSTSSRNFEDAGSQAIAARHQLERGRHISTVPIFMLVRLPAGIEDAASRRRVEELAAKARRDPLIAEVDTFYTTHEQAWVSHNGRLTYILAFPKVIPPEQVPDKVRHFMKEFKHEPGVLLGGPRVAEVQASDQVKADLTKAELLAFPILLLLSLVFFRGLVAALLPLVCGVLSIMSTFLILRVANTITPISIFALNLVTALGLGLAIDYSLFMVSRYREEVARVGVGREALRRTMTTAGRTVAYSALTVAAALTALLIFPQPFLYSMGIGGVSVALLSAVVALVVLPAILAWLGPRVNSLAPARWRLAAERTARMEEAGFWYRLSHGVMRRPVPVALATATLLIVLGVPFAGIKFTGLEAYVLPKSKSARLVIDTLDAQFNRPYTTPVQIAVHTPHSNRAAVKRYADEISALPGTQTVIRSIPIEGNNWYVEVIARANALTDASRHYTRELRAIRPPFPVKVGGLGAEFNDELHSLRWHLPFALLVIAIGTFVLLFLATASVVLPVKALVMNLLTLSATFGILVFIFQDGRLEGFLHYTSQGGLESTQPVLLFAVAFALSTDYAVFLLTRIKEMRDGGASNTESVAGGLERTGRIVTAAALLFSVAVFAFATSKIVFIKEVGVGIGVAVLIDATIVRALLVPSLMKLLGEWNWWAPRPLRRLHERIGIREAETPPPARAEAP